MKTTATKLPIPWLSLGLLAVLLALTPYAMSFAPHGSYYVGETVHTPDAPDSLYSLRVALIAFGLVATVVAFIEFVWTLRRGSRDFLSFASSFAAFFACAVLGWRSYRSRDSFDLAAAVRDRWHYCDLCGRRIAFHVGLFTGLHGMVDGLNS